MAIKKIDTSDIQKPDEDLHDFYTVTGGSGGVKIKFDKLYLCNRLRKLGFARYDQSDGKFEFVRLEDGKIKLTSVTAIKDAFEDFLLTLPDKTVKYTYTTNEDGEKITNTASTVITGYRLLDIFYNCKDTYFGSFLDRLRPNRPIELIQDTPDAKFVYYNNCIVKVTRDGFQKLPYDKQEEGYIWESNMLDRDFEENNGTGEFETFVQNICGRKQDRVNSLMTMLGYLMHDNYDCNLRAVLLTDVNQDDTTGTKAAGGTGKGLLGKALAHMLNRDVKSDTRYRAIPGKGFDAHSETRYQLADISTQLIHIEDLDHNFDISSLYNDITDGATFRKMYQGSNIHMTKFMLSVNHTIRIDSSSDKRRIYIFELFNHYDENFTPLDDFKHMLFGREWTTRDWNQFDTFMIRCISRYLRYGVEAAEVINYGDRRINEVFANREDFLYYFQDEVLRCLKSKDRKLDKDESWNKFIDKYPIYNNRKDKYNFTRLLQSYMDLKGVSYKSGRGHDSVYFILDPLPAGKQQELEFKTDPEP